MNAESKIKILIVDHKDFLKKNQVNKKERKISSSVQLSSAEKKKEKISKNKIIKKSSIQIKSERNGNKFQKISKELNFLGDTFNIDFPKISTIVEIEDSSEIAEKIIASKKKNSIKKNYEEIDKNNKKSVFGEAKVSINLSNSSFVFEEKFQN